MPCHRTSFPNILAILVWDKDTQSTHRSEGWGWMITPREEFISVNCKQDIFHLTTNEFSCKTLKASKPILLLNQSSLWWHKVHGQQQDLTRHKLLVQCLAYLTINVGHTSIIARQQIACDAAYLNRLMIFSINIWAPFLPDRRWLSVSWSPSWLNSVMFNNERSKC